MKFVRIGILYQFLSNLSSSSVVDAITTTSHVPPQSTPIEDEQLVQFGGTASAVIELDNINNQQYVGYVYIGKPQQKIKVLFDTGSPLMYIVTDKCEGCPKSMHKYNSQKSSSFNQLDSTEKQYYGSGAIEGHIAEDTVCFTEDTLSCIENAQFIAVDKAKDIDRDQFSGLIGLSPHGLESTKVPAFLNQGEEVFSFFLSKDTSQKGSIVMGGYDLEQFAQTNAKDEDIQWIGLAEEGWSIPFEGLKFMNSSEDIALKSSLLQLDTGLSYSMVPQEDITNVENALKSQNIECTEQHSGMGLDLYECECSEEDYFKLQPFEIKSGGKMFQIPVSAFLKKKEGKKCTLLMYPNDDTSLTVERKWVVGDTFLSNFYSIFDWKQKKIGLIKPKGDSREEPPQKVEEKPKQDSVQSNIQETQQNTNENKEAKPKPNSGANVMTDEASTDVAAPDSDSSTTDAIMAVKVDTSMLDY